MLLVVIKIQISCWRISINQCLLYISVHHIECVARWPHKNNFGISFPVTKILKLSRETDLCMVLVTNTKHINCSLFLDPHSQNSIEHPGMLSVMGKSIRKPWLDAVKCAKTSILWQWTNRKHFLVVHGNIWSSEVAFYNKTTWLLRHKNFNRYLSVVAPV